MKNITITSKSKEINFVPLKKITEDMLINSSSLLEKKDNTVGLIEIFEKGGGPDVGEETIEKMELSAKKSDGTGSYYTELYKTYISGPAKMSGIKLAVKNPKKEDKIKALIELYRELKGINVENNEEYYEEDDDSENESEDSDESDDDDFDEY